MSHTKYIIKSSRIVSGDVLIISLTPKDGGEVFSFKPGQYAMLSFFNANEKMFINHPFSIASSPTQKTHLEFGIKIMGKFTQTLSKLNVGAEVSVMGPYGDFVFDEYRHHKAVFIAGGIGITPFMSSMRYANDNELPNHLTLLYSNRTLNATSYLDEIKELNNKNPRLKAVLAITQETVNAQENYLEGGYITTGLISKHVGEIVGKDFFLCGPAAFMKTMEQHLRNLGVPANKIHQEGFSMSPKLPFLLNIKNLATVSVLTTLLFAYFINFVQAKKSKTKKPTVNTALLQSVNDATIKRRNDLIAAKQKAQSKIAAAKKTTVKTVSAPVKTKSPTVKITSPTVIKPRTPSTQQSIPAPTPIPTQTPTPIPTPIPSTPAPVVQQPSTPPPVVTPPTPTTRVS